MTSVNQIFISFFLLVVWLSLSKPISNHFNSCKLQNYVNGSLSKCFRVYSKPITNYFNFNKLSKYVNGSRSAEHAEANVTLSEFMVSTSNHRMWVKYGLEKPACPVGRLGLTKMFYDLIAQEV
jgi:hypothetical protein